MNVNGSLVLELTDLIKKAQDKVLVSVPGARGLFLHQPFPDSGWEQFQVKLSPQTLAVGDLHSLLLLSGGERAQAVLVSPDAIRLTHADTMLPPAPPTADPNGTVSVSTSDRVTLLGSLENEQRWNHVLPLRLHPAYVMVQRLVKTSDMPHREFIRLLRTVLAGFVDPVVVSRLRTMTVDQKGTAESKIGNGDAAFGKSLVQQAREGTGSAIPDEITVEVPVYDLSESREQRYSITLVLEVDPKDGKPIFTVTAKHNDVMDALEREQDRLVSLCHAVFPLVLRAQPNASS